MSAAEHWRHFKGGTKASILKLNLLKNFSKDVLTAGLSCFRYLVDFGFVSWDFLLLLRSLALISL